MDAHDNGEHDRMDGQQRHGLTSAVVVRLQNWSGVIAAVKGWRGHAISAGAGVASVLAMAPVFLVPVLFITLPVLLWRILGETDRGSVDLRAASIQGWWFGFGYFFAGLFWVGEAFLVEADVFGWLLPFAVTLLPAGLALFFALAAALTRYFWRPGLAGILTMAAAFGATEWLRGHVLTGFPWNLLGYALTSSESLMQSAALLGTYSLTLWTVLIFTGPVALIAGPGRDPRRSDSGVAAIALGIATVPVLAAVVYGHVALSKGPSSAGQDVRVRIVQPSVPQREKWLPEKQGEIFALHVALSRQDANGNDDDLKGVALVVWPEAAMPFRPLEHPDALDAIAKMLPDGVMLVSGGLRVEPASTESDGDVPAQRRAFNSLLVIDTEGQARAIYDKIHLVPFGEYLPFQPWLEAIGLRQLTKLRGGFTPGPSPRPVLRFDGLPTMAGLICYEAIFPGQIVQGGERPQLLVNITNDGWFGNTTGPRQHLHQARVRAVEEGLPLIRAANNGISALIDAHGRIVAALDLNQRGVIDAELPGPLAPTVYATWGDWIFLLNFLAFVVISAVVRRRSGPRRPI